MQSVPDGSRTVELCGYHFTVPSLVNPPYPPSLLTLLSLALRLSLPISARSGRRGSLPPSNLSTSGQPHLLAYPQDINRIQRLVSVYIHARIYTLVCTLLYTSVPINRRDAIETSFLQRDLDDVLMREKCEADEERSGDIISLLNFSLGKTSSEYNVSLRPR